MEIEIEAPDSAANNGQAALAAALRAGAIPGVKEVRRG
jgi:hypothetical protein